MVGESDASWPGCVNELPCRRLRLPVSAASRSGRLPRSAGAGPAREMRRNQPALSDSGHAEFTRRGNFQQRVRLTVSLPGDTVAHSAIRGVVICDCRYSMRRLLPEPFRISAHIS